MGIFKGKREDYSWALQAEPVPEGAEPVGDGAWRLMQPSRRFGEPGIYKLYEPPRPPESLWTRALRIFEDAILMGLDPEEAIARAVERAIPWRGRSWFRRKGENPPEDVVKAREALAYYLKRDLLGVGPLTPMIMDQRVEDIEFPLTGDDAIYVYRGGWFRTNVRLSKRDSEALARRLAEKLGRQITRAHPVAEGILELGGQSVRVHALLNPDGRGGATIHIRLYRRKPSLRELVRLGMLSPSIAAYLKLATVHGIPSIIYGRVGAGKTTLLNAIVLEIPPSRHVVVVEDTTELWFPEGTNFTRLLGRVSEEEIGTQPTIEELVRAVLRMRPDYIIVGESRGKEARVLAQYVRLGASGATTFHANTVHEAVDRLRALGLEDDLIEEFRIWVRVAEVPVNGARARAVVELHEQVEPTEFRLVTRLDFARRVWTPISMASLKIFDWIMEREPGVTREELTQEFADYKAQFEGV